MSASDACDDQLAGKGCCIWRTKGMTCIVCEDEGVSL